MIHVHGAVAGVLKQAIRSTEYGATNRERSQAQPERLAVAWPFHYWPAECGRVKLADPCMRLFACPGFAPAGPCPWAMRLSGRRIPLSTTWVLMEPPSTLSGLTLPRLHCDAAHAVLDRGLGAAVHVWRTIPSQPRRRMAAWYQDCHTRWRSPVPSGVRNVSFSG